ncbi:MAG: hypothetical protein DMG89_17790 [Acidobacteria bacterium]|nr:MAG: hypothetical protein DMG89_17790 [Acidobacteriota bacterium]
MLSGGIGYQFLREREWPVPVCRHQNSSDFIESSQAQKDPSVGNAAVLSMDHGVIETSAHL